MHLQVGERASMMAAHQPHQHLFDFSSSSPPNPAMAFVDHGALLALHDDSVTDMRAGGGGGLADTTPWPPQESLSLYNTAGTGSSLQVGGQQQPPFAAAPAVVAAPTSSMMSMQQPFRLKSSRYLSPVKELLGEFCSLEGDLHAAMNGRARTRAPKAGEWDDVEASSSWAINPSLSSMDFLALEWRKARLLSMVEEVDRRYRRYREQMRAAELSFEAAAGAGAAQVYTKLALRAMSRHFRCLRDALVGQIHALRKAMRESRDGGGVSAAAPGASRGDTPRLRALDQCLRQQRAFQQSGGGAVESYPWRQQRGLPESAVAVLRSWLFEHFLHPYPNDVDKQILARQTGLSRSQVSNWFINARVRLWKPMIEDMYTEETKQHGGGGKPDADHGSNAAAWTMARAGDQSRHLGGRNPSSCFVVPSIAADGVGGGQLLHGYPSLQGCSGGGAVSLTLGLQQQQPAFASTTMIMQQQSSLMMGAGEDEDAVLPYRNLMGSELLHDLAG